MTDQKSANRIDSPTTVPATTPQNGNPYIAYGLAAGGREGVLLKFSKAGEWAAGLGDDITTLPNGTELVAQMEYCAVVFTKWQATKPVDRKVTLIGTGAQPPRRDQLGDNNAADWDLDDEGLPRDPWQMTNELPLLDPHSGQQYVFSTSSKGGLAALGRLAVNYGRNCFKHAGEDPVVRLDSSGYDHPIKRYGYVHTPDFKIVRWEPRAPGAAPTRLTTSQEMNDDLPF